MRVYIWTVWLLSGSCFHWTMLESKPPVWVLCMWFDCLLTSGLSVFGSVCWSGWFLGSFLEKYVDLGLVSSCFGLWFDLWFGLWFGLGLVFGLVFGLVLIWSLGPLATLSICMCTWGLVSLFRLHLSNLPQHLGVFICPAAKLASIVCWSWVQIFQFVQVCPIVLSCSVLD